MLISSYNAVLVLASLSVAILAAYTALDLSGRIATAQGRAAQWWLAGGSCAMGLGIWSMHFIGMLAFHLPLDIGYDLSITLLSLVMAIAASAFALWLTCQLVLPWTRLLGGALLMGGGIAGMHYVGMAAMQMRPLIQYQPGLVVLSVLIAVMASGVALWSAFRLRSGTAHVRLWRVAVAMLMGLAIAGMHYTAMAAAMFASGSVCHAVTHGITSDWLALLVIVVTLAVLATALIISVFDARLESSTQEKALAYKKINDSIAYASLIQRSLLPNRLLHGTPGIDCAVLWLPRDVVGGDFYICHASAHGCLIGVMDCAGHGVPGALMTMLAHSVIDQTIAQLGPENPAALLMRIDLVARKMLGHEADAQLLATNIDIGLAYLDFDDAMLTFAGAKIDLYCNCGSEIQQWRGARRAIGDRHAIEYSNTRIALDGQTFYLTTDGFLDQAGGEHAYGFGNRRFKETIQRHAMLPLAQQAAAFKTTLNAYQGRHAQRDDITMLCFRFDSSKRAS